MTSEKIKPLIIEKNDYKRKVFDPNIEVHNILKWNKLDRKNNLKDFKKKLTRHYISISSIITDFENIVKQNPNINFETYIKDALVPSFFSDEIIEKLLYKFVKYFKDKEKSESLLEKYKNNQSKLLKILFNTEEIPEWNITFKVELWCIVVIFDSQSDYSNITNMYNSSWCFINTKNIICINSTSDSYDNNNILEHELQHYINSFKLKYRNYDNEINGILTKSKWFMWFNQQQVFDMKDKLLDDIISNNNSQLFKDELIAFRKITFDYKQIIANLLSYNSNYLKSIPKKDKIEIKQEVINSVFQLTQLNNSYGLLDINLFSIMNSKQINRIIDTKDGDYIKELYNQNLKSINKEIFIKSFSENIIKFLNPIFYLDIMYKKLSNLINK